MNSATRACCILVYFNKVLIEKRRGFAGELFLVVCGDSSFELLADKAPVFLGFKFIAP